MRRMSATPRSRGWWMPQVGWAAVLATTFGVVVVFLPGGADPWFVPKVAALAVGTSVALACHIGALLGRRDRVVLPRVGVAVLAYAGAMALATALSVSPISSLLGRAGRRTGLIEMTLLLVLAWLVVVHTWRRPEKLVQLAAAVVAAAGVHAAYVVLVRVGIDVPWPSTKPYTIPVGTMANSNFAGALLVMGVPLVVVLRSRATGGRGRLAWLALAALLLIALFFTDARGAAIALFPALAVAGLVSPGLLPRWSVRTAVALSLVALVPVVAAAMGFSWGSGSPGAKLLNNETLHSRFEYWKGTAGLVRDHPVVGTGPDTFGLVFPRYSPREMTGRPVPVDKPHNILLERATDAGVLGLASYLAVLALTGATVVRARRTTGAARALLGGWSGVLVAYLIQGFTSIDALPLAMIGWLAIAALASIADPWVVRARERAPATSPARPVSIFVTWALTASVLAVTLLVLVAWAADLYLGDGLNRSAAVARGDPEYMMTESFMFAIDTNPVDPSVRVTAAATVADLLGSSAVTDGEKRFLASFAVQQSERALEQVPDDLAARRAAAIGHGVLARDEGDASWRATDQRWREIEALDPFDSTTRLDHADLLLDWNDATGPDPARHAAARALVDDANALTDDSSWFTWYRVAQAYERLGARDEAIAAARHSLTIERARPGPRDLITRLGATP